MKQIEVDDYFPKFSLKSSSETIISEKDLLGNFSIVYVYPKDDTPSCTKEAINFQAHLAQFIKSSIFIYGLSKDDIAKHIKFQRKYDLEFPLISDPEIILIKKLGLWVEKSMYGKKYLGVERTTFLLSPENKILKIWRKVKVLNHTQEVFKDALEAKNL